MAGGFQISSPVYFNLALVIKVTSGVQPITVLHLEMKAMYNVVYGDDGEQYVTVVQEGQTYAIPYAEYQKMLSQEGSITVQATPIEMVASGPASSPAAPASRAPASPRVAASPDQVDVAILPDPPKVSEGESITETPLTGPETSPTPPPVSEAEARNLKPIRVDNWGIFLLSRLQTYFQKKELCDLTLRFPHQNAQIQVHKLVVNACCDYFLSENTQASIIDGHLDMPSDFTPEAVAPVIRFMYTGRLDMKFGMFPKLRETASLMGLQVLTKLMDAQLSALANETPKPKKRRASAGKIDPVRQIKRIKQIERRFTNEEKRAKIQAKREAVRQMEEVDKANVLPGKKLPIWRKRSTNPHEAEPTTGEKQPPMRLTPVSGPPPGARLVPLRGPPPANLTPIASLPPNARLMRVPPPRGLIETPRKMDLGRAYTRVNANSAKPKIPRQIREIQENLNFEKIRKTGAKNPSSKARYEEESPPKDMSVDELKEFMAEQRKRLTELGDYAGMDDDDDDFFDNDETGLDYEDEDDETPDEPETPKPKIATPTKPILKTEKVSADSPVDSAAPRKSVRFSLRATPTQKTPTDPGHSNEPTGAQPTSSTALADSLDTTLDEFNKVVEAENHDKPAETPLAKKHTYMRKARGSDLDKCSLTQLYSRQSGVIDLPSEVEKKVSTMDTPVPMEKEASEVVSVAMVPDIAELTADVLRKYPNFINDNKPIKLKVMSKNSQGEAAVQFITLKTGLSQNGETVVMASASDTLTEDVVDVRSVPKVKYCGKRGRPKKLLASELDPHAAERKVIAEHLGHNVKGPMKMIMKEEEIPLDQVSYPDTTVSLIESTAPQLASEVGSFVTDLGLVTTTSTLTSISEALEASAVSGATILVPSSELQELQGTETTILVDDHTQFLVTSQVEGNPIKVVQTVQQGEAFASVTDLALESGDGSDGKEGTKKTVSQLAMDWEEDD
eukprot:maker-scaffold99_size374999-snap-gene-0.21 protein:Tk10052 transcript:maker-scaffold99_size374999-snap-gene-0.21-mRNA-1 annotation:"centrosome-associated zinc finger protein cp190"